MSRLEKDEEKEVVRWCKSNGVLFIKFTPFGERGYPDRIAIFPGGKHLWIELKRRGKKPRKLQIYRMQQLIDQGVETQWFDNAEDCINYLGDML